jgi:hypothetical protein
VSECTHTHGAGSGCPRFESTMSWGPNSIEDPRTFVADVVAPDEAASFPATRPFRHHRRRPRCRFNIVRHLHSWRKAERRAAKAQHFTPAFVAVAFPMYVLCRMMLPLLRPRRTHSESVESSTFLAHRQLVGPQQHRRMTLALPSRQARAPHSIFLTERFANKNENLA